MEGFESPIKKHKKHKKDRHEGLKLILKVGNSSTPEHNMDESPSNFSVQVTGDEDSVSSLAAAQFPEKHKKSKKKKKKKEKEKDKDRKKKHHKEKRKKRDGDVSMEENNPSGDGHTEPPVKKMKKDTHKIHALLTKPPRQPPKEGIVSSIKTEPRSCVRKLKEQNSPLQKLLEHLHGLLEKRDMQQFFAWPVTDNIAPGYSNIISQPMDFSTMKQKIDDGAYSTLNQYIDDFKLMCGNAMTYNHPDTIYFKSAKKLLHSGLKVTSADKLKQMVHTLPCMLEIPESQLGFDLEEKRSAKLEYENLRKKISNDKINIETVNKRIDQLSSESNEVSLENNALKESIDTLRTRLNHLQIRVKERNIRMISNPHPQQSQHRSIPQNETHDTDIGVKKVHVLGDSNVRGLGAIMSQNYANSKTRILTSCIPGGGLCQLKNSFIQDPVPGDTIILHAGTNDICHTKWEEIKKSLEEMCTGFSQCNIVVFTVPPRYDYPYLNKHINKFNTLVKYAVQNYGNVRLVITKRIITPKQMKADGIHYNQRGQQKIAKKMMDFSSRIGHQLRDSMTIISLDTTEAPHIAPHSSTETAPVNNTNEKSLHDELDESSFFD
ncbi:hypothetical protein M8J77_015237 [Diaphorina citri]|nr:hypothetical protein M8J77_015237 [Diaphorina citri]